MNHKELPQTFVYLRCSTNMQSADSHQCQIDSYIKSRGLDKYKVVTITDTAISGAKSWKKRSIYPVITEAPRKSHLVVSELSRLGRSQFELLEMLEVAKRGGLTIHAIKENFIDDDSVQSLVCRSSFSMMAQLERNMTQERIKSAMATRRLKNIIPGPKHENNGMNGEVENIRADYERGMMMKELAEKYGVTYNRMYQFCRSRYMVTVKKEEKHNNTLPMQDRLIYIPRGEIRKSKYDMSIDKINERLKEGKSLCKISEEMGFDPYSFKKYVEKRHKQCQVEEMNYTI